MTTRTCANFWPLLALLAFSYNGVAALDFCREYGIANLAFSPFYCIDYCCGTCNYRYCCSNETFILDQDLCTNTINQAPLQIAVDKPVLPSPPPTTLSKKILMVASLDSDPPRESCDAFTNQQGYSLASQQCPSNARFCCGTCSNRYCCSLARERLYQTDCKSSSITSDYRGISASQLSASTYINIIIILGVILVLTFICTPLLILVNRRARIRRESNQSNINNLSILSSASSMSLSSISSVPKIQQNPSAEEMPPPYVSLKFNQK